MTIPLALHALAQPGHSMVCRVTKGPVHPAASAHGFWCAYYSAPVVENRWEPFDQPTPSSYMPCRYSDFDTVRLAGGGALLLECTPRPSRAVVRRSHPGMISTARDGLSVAEVISLLEFLLVPFQVSRPDRVAFLNLASERVDLLIGASAAA
jgi:hypothetical protein